MPGDDRGPRTADVNTSYPVNNTTSKGMRALLVEVQEVCMERDRSDASLFHFPWLNTIPSEEWRTTDTGIPTFGAFSDASIAA